VFRRHRRRLLLVDVSQVMSHGRERDWSPAGSARPLVGWGIDSTSKDMANVSG
jgi:hypothetical protein